MAQTAEQLAGDECACASTPQITTTMRLDPWHLADRIVQKTENGSCWTIDRQGAVLKRRLPSGLDISLALPKRAFKGVAARAVEHDDGSYTVSLELHHHDPQLCVPLLVSEDMCDVAADWHVWSRMFGLPMLMIGADGAVRPIREELGAVLVNQPQMRRKRLTAVKRRPWFARRRKTGNAAHVQKISGEELIARS